MSLNNVEHDIPDLGYKVVERDRIVILTGSNRFFMKMFISLTLSMASNPRTTRLAKEAR